ncbi:MAG: chromatin protein Cren7 [Ignisphaera sp.]|uniref:Chorismate-binding protein n=1 Tax=Ignisphaera aggregans TaxID=334771 RepID=A0A832CRN3_9CREN
MSCKKIVKVKDPYSHQDVLIAPEKIYIIKNHRGKEIKIGLFKSPKTLQYFRALLSNIYICE